MAGAGAARHVLKLQRALPVSIAHGRSRYKTLRINVRKDSYAVAMREGRLVVTAVTKEPPANEQLPGGVDVVAVQGDQVSYRFAVSDEPRYGTSVALIVQGETLGYLRANAAKSFAELVREADPSVDAQVQGGAVRVTSAAPAGAARVPRRDVHRHLRDTAPLRRTMSLISRQDRRGVAERGALQGIAAHKAVHKACCVRVATLPEKVWDRQLHDDNQPRRGPRPQNGLITDGYGGPPRYLIRRLLQEGDVVTMVDDTDVTTVADWERACGENAVRA